MDCVIFASPTALLLYGAALLLCLYDRFHPGQVRWMNPLSTAVCICASSYGLLLGATLREIAAILMIFLLLNMGVRP